MKAAIAYEANTPLKIEDVDIAAKPGSREVLVKLMASGVCHSDWHILKGEWGNALFPAILGHEGAGVVEAVGDEVTRLKKGDHVILAWRTSCGICEMCQRGHPVLCLNSPVSPNKPKLAGTDKTLGAAAGLGTFAGHALVPEIAAVLIDPEIPFAQAALLGCGVMTGVGAAINTAQVRPGSTCAVFGCGGVGLNVIQGCAIAGADMIIAVDMLDNKLEMGRTFGATHTVNASKGDPVQQILDLTGGLGVHYAFEAIGLVPEPFLQSVLCTRRRGVTTWVGHAPLNTPVTIDARALMQEKTVMASMYGSARPHIDFPRLLNLYRDGKLKLDELITRRFELADVNEAFEVLKRGEVARSVLNLEPVG
ncbi:MAG TPA: Zn-dependent alcohol dehydrogenase [Chloroflexota bacterium]|jgi:S-(hydroxymethyl)glutathione dehydrogenase/alcohol dehydrogenase|nr:Zn-dependent alcohol dehydrogenase [Chloroflexota bacterium]